jgi:hypothetical protein
MTTVNWDIRPEGRAYTIEEAYARDELLPNARIELIDGKFFHSDEERLIMLAVMLENLGIDAAVRLGNPDHWRQAVAALPPSAGQ